MSMMLADARRKRVLGIASTGRLIYAISGSEGEDENDGNNSGENKGGEGSGSNEGGGAGGSGGTGSEGIPTPRVYSQEEYDTLQRRLAAADKTKGEFERKLREIDDADKSELEKAKRDLEEATKRAEKAEADALAGKLANEILKFPGFVWHDPESVLKLVDMETISVDAETGKVIGVKDALTKLAKDKPYLLKGKQDANGKDGGKGGGNGASGHNPGSAGGDTTDKNKAREKLVSKYKL